MNKSTIAQRFFLFVLIFLSGCGSSPDVQISELNHDTISYDETLRMNNCGGKANSEQTASRSFSTSTEGGFDFGVQQVVEGVISAKYSQYKNDSRSLTLVAPAGTSMEFIVRWTEQVRAGNVTVNGKTGTYTVNIPIAVEQVSGNDLGCPGGVQPIAPVIEPTQISQPTKSVVMSQTQLLGEWLYQQARAPMPAPAGENQVIFAHGDIDNSGTCHVKEFGTGESVQGLGLGGFKLWLITGTPEYIKDVENQLQRGAAAHAGTDCPYLP